MNNKRNRTKLTMVALLVALASLATAGVVLADHFPPVGSVSKNSLIAFQQYQAAIDHAEETNIAALSAMQVNKVNSWALYEQFYQEVLEEILREQKARVLALSSTNTPASRDGFVPYHSPTYWR